MRRRNLAAIVLCATALAAASAGAQEKKAKIRPTGVRAIGGLVVPENAENAFGLGASIHLGTLFKPWLHLSAGATRWSADIDRTALSSDAAGTISDVRVFTDLGFELFDLSGVQPYFDIGLALHNVDATIPDDPSLQEALQGRNVGAALAFGVASSAGFFRLSAEARREFVDDVDNWSFLLGIGTRWDKAKTKKDPGLSRNASAAPALTQAVPPSDTPSLDARMQQVLAENRSLRDQMSSLEKQLRRQQDRATQAEILRLERQQEEMKRSLEELRLVSANAGSLQETQDGLLLSLRSSVLFATGSSFLQAGAGAELARVAAILNKFPSAAVVVEGHTDATGDPARNVELSQERANAVARELELAGVQNLRAIGFGAERPIADDSTPDGRARNRRVEIRVLPKITTASAAERP